MRVLQTAAALARTTRSYDELARQIESLVRQACPHYVSLAIHEPHGDFDADLRVAVVYGGHEVGVIAVVGSPLNALDRALLEDVADILAASWGREHDLMQAGDATRAIAGAWPVSPDEKPVATPIYTASTYRFDDMEALEQYLEHQERGFIYTRWGNPTVRAVEETIAMLEGAEESVLMSSGMAAIANAVLSIVGHGDEIVCAHNTYGGTHHLFADVLPRFGISVRFVDGAALHDLAPWLRDRTRLVYFEPVTNPTLGVIDVARVVEACRPRNVAVVVDNTVASPVFLRPLALGVDIVVHSATKYLGGHSDLIAGVASGSRAAMAGVKTLLRYLGNCFNPREAALLSRGLKTLSLRVRHQDAAARRIALWLQGRAEVKRVWHPSLPSHPDHATATRLLEGFGCLVSIELQDAQRARQFVDSLTLFHRAASLGSVESLVTLPVLSSHWKVGAESLAAAGVTDATVRLSIGVEDTDDLLADLERALTAGVR